MPGGSATADLRPAVPEAERAVEDEPAQSRVGIRAEVAESLELHRLADRQLRERRLDQAVLEHRLRGGVEVGDQVAVGAGIGPGEEMVVQADLGGHRVRGRDPVERGLRPAPIRRVAAAGRRVVRAAELDDLTARVLHHAGAGHEVGVPKADLATRREAEELPRRVLDEVVALDPELAREGGPCASRPRDPPGC